MFRMAERERPRLAPPTVVATTEEERQAHVARLRAAGRLSFETPEEALRRLSWWQRLRPAEAQATLDRLAVEAGEAEDVPF